MSDKRRWISIKKKFPCFFRTRKRSNKDTAIHSGDGAADDRFLQKYGFDTKSAANSMQRTNKRGSNADGPSAIVMPVDTNSDTGSVDINKSEEDDHSSSVGIGLHRAAATSVGVDVNAKAEVGVSQFDNAYSESVGLHSDSNSEKDVTQTPTVNSDTTLAIGDSCLASVPCHSFTELFTKCEVSNAAEGLSDIEKYTPQDAIIRTNLQSEDISKPSRETDSLIKIEEADSCSATVDNCKDNSKPAIAKSDKYSPKSVHEHCNAGPGKDSLHSESDACGLQPSIADETASEEDIEQSAIVKNGITNTGMSEDGDPLSVSGYNDTTPRYGNPLCVGTYNNTTSKDGDPLSVSVYNDATPEDGNSHSTGVDNDALGDDDVKFTGVDNDNKSQEVVPHCTIEPGHEGDQPDLDALQPANSIKSAKSEMTGSHSASAHISSKSVNQIRNQNHDSASMTPAGKDVTYPFVDFTSSEVGLLQTKTNNAKLNSTKQEPKPPLDGAHNSVKPGDCENSPKMYETARKPLPVMGGGGGLIGTARQKVLKSANMVSSIPEKEITIPKDGNLASFSADDMATFLRYLRLEDRLVNHLHRNGLDGRKFGRLKDDDLDNLQMKNPIAAYFRDRTSAAVTKKSKPKLGFVL